MSTLVRTCKDCAGPITDGVRLPWCPTCRVGHRHDCPLCGIRHWFTASGEVLCPCCREQLPLFEVAS
jgi:hypothetical protein